MPDTKSGPNQAFNLRAAWRPMIGRRLAIASAGLAIAAPRTGIPAVEKRARYNATNN
ncbi:hypothetical protein OHD62_13795 [Mesorhizobium sp. YC-39]|uniref:hypothetical protein n=1 Tax=unclassified Mesorhizobium TaxID=325217 RepID=UPI0021E7EFC0|nr:MULTISPECIES: hypothetical protein [unclassified Mesorhizobium]MCV3207712.1 hypothetical protein [Mesorhizobium sp. YC-2]MCV3229439.1 hypothetical protein [Mesorhizobium sp. YC-39]